MIFVIYKKYVFGHSDGLHTTASLTYIWPSSAVAGSWLPKPFGISRAMSITRRRACRCCEAGAMLASTGLLAQVWNPLFSFVSHSQIWGHRSGFLLLCVFCFASSFYTSSGVTCEKSAWLGDFIYIF